MLCGCPSPNPRPRLPASRAARSGGRPAPPRPPGSGPPSRGAPWVGPRGRGDAAGHAGLLMRAGGAVRRGSGSRAPRRCNRTPERALAPGAGPLSIHSQALAGRSDAEPGSGCPRTAAARRIPLQRNSEGREGRISRPLAASPQTSRSAGKRAGGDTRRGATPGARWFLRADPFSPR